MQAIHIIVSILSSIAYIGMTTFVCYLFLQHRKMKEQIDFIAYTVSKIFAIVSSLKLQSSFDKISEMQELMQKLVRDENYEEAENLKAVLEEGIKDAFKSLEAFKATFGEEVAASVISIQTKRS